MRFITKPAPDARGTAMSRESAITMSHASALFLNSQRQRRWILCGVGNVKIIIVEFIFAIFGIVWSKKMISARTEKGEKISIERLRYL